MAGLSVDTVTKDGKCLLESFCTQLVNGASTLYSC
jgi:hypothetical protein